MKTIVHIELSDSDRNDLARRIYRDPNTKVLVTRKEVTELVHALVQQEIEDGSGIQEHISSGEVHGASGCDGRTGDDSSPQAHGWADHKDFLPSRGDEDYIARPKDPGVAAACSRILDDAALIEQFAWETIDRNRRK